MNLKPQGDMRINHLLNGDEKGGSSAYVPPDATKDKQLIAAVDFIRGVRRGAANSPAPAPSTTTTAPSSVAPAPAPAPAEAPAPSIPPTGGPAGKSD